MMKNNSPCPVCGSSVFIPIKARADLALCQCRSCGLRRAGIPAGGVAGLYNTRGYYAAWGIVKGNEAHVAAMKKTTFGERLRGLEKFRRKGKILDVGCATGFFLEAARARGWEPSGIEINKFAARRAQDKFGEAVWCGPFENAPVEKESFDAVVMCDLLEHLPDPAAALRKTLEVLKPGGVLSITCPNVSSLSARITGDAWYHYKKEHLYYFSPATLRRLLKSAGFEVAAIRSAPKALTVEYIALQFSVFRSFPLSQISAFISRILPVWLRRKPFMLLAGEMTVLARKPGGPA